MDYIDKYGKTQTIFAFKPQKKPQVNIESKFSI